MIPYNATITLVKTKTDRWGISVPNVNESQKAFLNYRLKTKGNEINTRDGTNEVIPSGFVIVKGFNSLTPDDFIEWDVEGRAFRVKPDELSYIKDGTGKVLFTKAVF